MTSTAHAHFADSFVSVTVSSSRVTSHCWGFTAVLTVLWCYCCYNHSGTIKIMKDFVAPVSCSKHHLFPISPLEEGSAFLCLRQCSPISAHDSLESTLSSKKDTSRIYHMHVSRPCCTCKCTLRKSKATTKSCLIQLIHLCTGNMSRFLDLPQICWCIIAEASLRS